VVDIQRGLTLAVSPYLTAKGWQGDPERLVTWWRRAHFENSMIDALLRRGHTEYREIGFISLDSTLERAGIRHTDEEVRRLVNAIERLPPFPDAAEALGRLWRRFRLAVLSNGDPDMLERGLRHAGLGFDAVFSVAAAGSFKPDGATYDKARLQLQLQPQQVLFVANHPFDCIGAKAAGMMTAFVDRRHRPFGRWRYQPDLVAPDLSSLADALTLDGISGVDDSPRPAR
jgi:2-haloacid dehalogenase